MSVVLQNNIIAFLVGVASSALVASYFYSRGKHDAKRQHLKSQVDTVLLSLARCDPTQKGAGRRGDDGLETTAHWIGCMVDVLERSGSAGEATVLREVRADMERLIADLDATPEQEVLRRKQAWQAKVEKIVT